MSDRQLLAALLALSVLLASCTSGVGSDTAANAEPTTAGVTQDSVHETGVDDTGLDESGADERAGDEETGVVADLASLVAAVELLVVTPHRAESFWDLPDDGDDDVNFDANRPISSYEFDGTWSHFTGFLGPNQATGEPMSFTITDRNTAYFYLPGFAQLPTNTSMFANNPLAAAVDDWIQVDVAAVEAAAGPAIPISINESAFDTIAEIAETLEAADIAVEGSASSSRGFPTTTFEVTAEADEEIDLFNTTSIITVHLDDQARVREVVSTNDTFSTSSIQFFGFDDDIVIRLPVEATDTTVAWVEAFDQAPASPAQPAPTLAPLPTPTRTVEGPTVLDLIDAQPELSTFRTLITEAGVEPILDLPNPEPWTVFAPTNDVLASLGAPLDALRQEPLRLRTFVSAHIAKGAFSLETLAQNQTVETFDGWKQDVTRSNGLVMVGFASRAVPVLVGDATAADGVVHVINGTLGQLPAE